MWLDALNLTVQVGARIQASCFRAEAACNSLENLRLPFFECWLNIVKPSRTWQGFLSANHYTILYHRIHGFASQIDPLNLYIDEL